MAISMETARVRWNTLTDKGRRSHIASLFEAGYAAKCIVERLPASKTYVIEHLKARAVNLIGYTKRQAVLSAIRYIEEM